MYLYQKLKIIVSIETSFNFIQTKQYNFISAVLLYMYVCAQGNIIYNLCNEYSVFKKHKFRFEKSKQCMLIIGILIGQEDYVWRP